MLLITARISRVATQHYGGPSRGQGSEHTERRLDRGDPAPRLRLETILLPLSIQDPDQSRAKALRPATPDGPDLDALEKLCATRPVRAIHTMPTLHNPLGRVMPATDRTHLVEVARQHGALIIEDASYACLVEDPPPPLAATAPDITVYVSGLSKSVAAALARRHISVATAEPFTTSMHTPQAIRLALGSTDLDSLRSTLRTVRRGAVEDAYA
ncbi:aminotransferase class I/II-fold pyridoxal phosphate-dependent enzyme [Streptomyces sp. DT193]|uniref:aminotransferase class I/II-fold pyridoxal phosphate-dependent enzyme n=1 Tax=Streptomyces sp. DT193 TaxID=3393418 RepID=UPI003CF4A714